jgi:hypothetical protein
MGSYRKPLKRPKGKQKPPKKRFLVYVEGAITERLYLSGIKRTLSQSNISIEIGLEAGEPLRIVKRAVRQAADARRTDAYDEVWCIFDVEAPEPHGSLDEAMALAKKNNIKCAISNPCFEFWLVLHIADCSAYKTTDQACSLAREKIASYNEKAFLFDDVSGGMARAAKAAEQLEGKYEAHIHVRDRNPSSSMWKFIQAVHKISKVPLL